MLDDGDNGDDGFDDDDDVVDDVVDDVDDLRCFYIHRRPHTHVLTYKNLPTENFFSHGCFYTHTSTPKLSHTHTGAFTQVLLCTETFTQIGFHTHSVDAQKFSHTCLHNNFYTGVCKHTHTHKKTTTRCSPRTRMQSRRTLL